MNHQPPAPKTAADAAPPTTPRRDTATVESRSHMFEEEERLRDRADAAYQLARREVFNKYGGHQPLAPTPDERAILTALERAEEALHACRDRIYGKRRA